MINQVQNSKSYQKVTKEELNNFLIKEKSLGRVKSKYIGFVTPPYYCYLSGNAIIAVECEPYEKEDGQYYVFKPLLDFSQKN